MERLTEEKQIGPWASLKDKAEAIPGAFANYDCLMAHMTAVTRLKAYEDTGLEPDRICEFMEKWVKVVELAGLMKQEGIEHLRELVRAEKDSRLVVLPCKVGDTVWLVFGKDIIEAKVRCVRPFVFSDRVEFRGNATFTIEDPFYDDGRPLTQETFIIFSKDAFLAREEAERALEKEE